MRAGDQNTRACRRLWIAGCLFLGVALGAAACSDGDGSNLLGTPQAELFNDKCGDALTQVIAEHPEWGNPTPVTIEREREDGINVWGVELSNGVEVEFAEDDPGCRVLEIEHGDDDAGGDDDDDAEGDD